MAKKKYIPEVLISRSTVLSCIKERIADLKELQKNELREAKSSAKDDAPGAMLALAAYSGYADAIDALESLRKDVLKIFEEPNP